MNITPEFRTSKEWKKFKRALGHPAAMEFYVNLACELEGITRKAKCDTGHLGTDDKEDLLLMACADEHEGIEATLLEEALINSGIMTKDEKGYRLLTWEIENANLISNRQNGRKGGRKKNPTESNPTQITQNNKTEYKGTEPNRTGGLTQQEPTDNPGFFRASGSGTNDPMELNYTEDNILDKIEPY
jgi:hypothetical protein